MEKRTLMFMSLLAACLFALSPIAGCDDVSAPKTSKSSSNTDTGTNADDHEDESDYDVPETVGNVIYLYDTYIETTATGVTLSDEDTVATITASGDYGITGALDDGRIIVNVDTTADSGTVRLLLDDADITCSSNASLDIESAEKTIVVINSGTNTLTSSGLPTGEDDPNAALFSRDDLTIYGVDGSLAVNGNAGGSDGIGCKDGLIINDAEITVNAADDGVRGKDYVVIEGDSTVLNINSTGDGIKSDNDEDSAKGYISIEGGEITVATGADGDAIGAQTDVIIAGGTFDLTTGGTSSSLGSDASAKGIKGGELIHIEDGAFTIDSLDDAIHSNADIVIDGGTFSISTSNTVSVGGDAIHADSSIEINGGTITITKAYEGIEGNYITVNDGTISIVDSDDGFNATSGSGGEEDDGSWLYINGGTIYMNVASGDGLDSNGSIAISGGTIIAYGPSSSPNVGMDYNGALTITGGLLIVTGPNSGSMIQPSGSSNYGSSSTQYCLKVTSSSFSTSSFFHIQNASGEDILTFKPEESMYYLIFSSPDLASGSHSIYTGGTYSDGSSMHGLYTGGSYSNSGSAKKTFSISSRLTSTSF